MIKSRLFLSIGDNFLTILSGDEVVEEEVGEEEVGEEEDEGDDEVV